MLCLRTLLVLAFVVVLPVAGCKTSSLSSGLGKPPPVPDNIRPRAIATIESLAKHQDRHVRAGAIQVAADTMGVLGRRIVMNGLSDREPNVRFVAAMSAGDMKLPEAKQALQKLLRDPDYSVRIGACYALHKLGDTRFTRYLERTARSPDERVRANTVLAMGRLGEESALRILRDMRRDRATTVRLLVSEAMWRLGDDAGLTDLLSLMNGDEGERIFAAQALAERESQGPNVRQHIRTLFLTDFGSEPHERARATDVRLAAARALGKLGSDEGFGLAVQQSTSSIARHRAMAAAVFTAIGRKDGLPYVAPLLDDADPAVRTAAAGAVLTLTK
jgi:HEAT repeat protein